MKTSNQKGIKKVSLRTHVRVISEIFRYHILGSKKTRYLIAIFAFLTIFSKFIEILSVGKASQMQKVFDEKTDEEKTRAVILYVALNFVFFTINEALAYIFSGPIQHSTRVAMRTSFKKFISLDYTDFHNIGTGEVYACIDRQGIAVFDILDVLVLEVLPGIAAVIMYSVLMGMKLGWMFPSIMLLFFSMFVVLTAKITDIRSRIRQKLNERINTMCNGLYDTLINYETVVAYNNRDAEVQRLDTALEAVEKHNVELFRTLFMLNFVQRTIFLVQLLIILIMGAHNLYSINFNGEKMLLYVGFARSLGIYLFKSGYLYGRYTLGVLNYSSCHKAADPESSAGELLEKHTDSIEFKNVSIMHGDRIILRDLNFKILKGEKIAIIGRNGIGKSSLMKVLIGFTRYQGTITIDKKRLQDLSINSVRERIAYIHQDSSIFNETVKYNIMYGNFQASDAEICAVAKKLDVHDSIVRLEKGYDTTAGERGINLSGGERQKIAFARSELKNGDIIMLDEPTASLDKRSEDIILKRLFDMSVGKTVFMILHNLDFLENFDRIIYLSDAGNTQLGSLEDLQGSNQEFNDFYAQRIQGIES